jgi:hypothetical protein
VPEARLAQRFGSVRMRIWPISPSLNREIAAGGAHWLGDFFINLDMWLRIRRSRRIDKFIASADRSRPDGSGAGKEIVKD